MRGKRRCLLLSGILLAAVLLAAGIGFLLSRPGNEPSAAEEPENNAYPLYISALFASDDALWILRARSSVGIPREYDLHTIGADGQEHYVRQFPGEQAVWNEDDASILYLSDAETLCAYDPETGDMTTHALEQEYLRICAVDRGNVFLQQENGGTVTMVTDSYAEEQELGIHGRVVAAYEGRLLLWDGSARSLPCYDYTADQTVWHKDLFRYYSDDTDPPVLCESGGNLYLADSNGGEILFIEQFTRQSEIRHTGVRFSQVLAMADAGEYVVCASNASNAIRLFALQRDGTRLDLTEWQGPHPYRNAIMLLAIQNGTLYCTLSQEDGLFSFDLAGQ